MVGGGVGHRGEDCRTDCTDFRGVYGRADNLIEPTEALPQSCIEMVLSTVFCPCFEALGDLLPSAAMLPMHLEDDLLLGLCPGPLCLIGGIQMVEPPKSWLSYRSRHCLAALAELGHCWATRSETWAQLEDPISITACFRAKSS
jgi:hypothetical protein